jgi:hypothetical protein
MMQNDVTADEIKFRWILNSWDDLSTKTTKISVPQILMIL